jgi:hypothetical protein
LEGPDGVSQERSVDLFSSAGMAMARPSSRKDLAVWEMRKGQLAVAHSTKGNVVEEAGELVQCIDHAHIYKAGFLFSLKVKIAIGN